VAIEYVVNSHNLHNLQMKEKKHITSAIDQFIDFVLFMLCATNYNLVLIGQCFT